MSVSMDWEDFQDIGPWCAVAPSSVLPEKIQIIDADESPLTTPDFEQSEFHFETNPEEITKDVTETWNNGTTQQLPDMFTTDPTSEDASCISPLSDSTSSDNPLFNKSGEHLLNNNNVYNNNNNNNGGDFDRNITSVNGLIVNNRHKWGHTTVIKDEQSEDSIKSVEELAYFSKSNNTMEDLPECSSNGLISVEVIDNYAKRPKLSLDTSASSVIQNVIDTPDVISTVLDLNNTEFDLLRYIDCGEVEALQNVFDSAPFESNTNSSSSFESRTYSSPVQNTINKPRRRTARIDSIASKTQIKIEPTTAVRRGRPPKRLVSISSEISDDSDVSKYRELRNKNNEASRRSRVNRKLKEEQMEQEASVLEQKNIRLKTRVEELEKMVSRMRETLLHTVTKSKT